MSLTLKIGLRTKCPEVLVVVEQAKGSVMHLLEEKVEKLKISNCGMNISNI